ncbi:MAG: hypothetical protein LC796_17580 [Acidobacteria bacterium]|nr:hypothetical protein [Acidobacteriota bacterium]MCA1610794.1 hypothetical protein [Acidobacteriota bacterium]
MSCREIERLLAAEAPQAERESHRASCADCEILGRDLATAESLVSGLQAPAWSPELREALLRIPALTVSCEGAELLIAASLEPGEESVPTDRSRLQFHVSRCEGCREAFETLSTMGDLTPPLPAPWVAGRLSAAKPVKARARWRGFLDPRAAIAFAYAAALVLMLAGFNPADLARKAGAGLKSETKSVAVVADASLANRLGAFQQRATRSLAVWRGRAGGYGRAVLSNVLALVMRPEERPRPPQGRPRDGGEGNVPKNETSIPTWRA